MFEKIRKKKATEKDLFKRLIHRLSAMETDDLEKIDKLLNLVFEEDQKEIHAPRAVPPPEPTLEQTITQAQSQLHKEQLEKNLEKFRKGK